MAGPTAVMATTLPPWPRQPPSRLPPWPSSGKGWTRCSANSPTSHCRGHGRGAVCRGADGHTIENCSHWGVAIVDRRDFLKNTGLAALAAGIPWTSAMATDGMAAPLAVPLTAAERAAKADHSLRIASGILELGPKRFVSTTLYNGDFPGPLLRFKEGQRTIVDVFNDTDNAEQVHWHGQHVPDSVDGAFEEHTPPVPAHGHRRLVFTPTPSGLRYYHTHVRAGNDLARGLYTGLAGPVYIEPKHDPGAYDREVFLTLKEFQPYLNRVDMDGPFMAPGGMDFDLVGIAAKADPGQARRARAAAGGQRQRHRELQPCPARPHIQGHRAGRQSRADAGRGAGAVAGHGRARFRHRGNEPPWRLGA